MVPNMSERPAFSFMDLPPELRNFIYDFDCVIPKNQTYIIDHPRQSAPAIMRCLNKQLFVETMPKWRANNIFEIHGTALDDTVPKTLRHLASTGALEHVRRLRITDVIVCKCYSCLEYGDCGHGVKIDMAVNVTEDLYAVEVDDGGTYRKICPGTELAEWYIEIIAEQVGKTTWDFELEEDVSRVLRDAGSDC